MITWITAHDGTQPFVKMAENLKKSIHDADAGACIIVDVEPNGGHYLIEMYGAMYPAFTQFITMGPVVILDSDCLVKAPIDDLFEKDFDIAAIHRGNCVNSMGKQDFLGCFIGFNPRDPNFVRKLWTGWMNQTFKYLNKEPVASAVKRRENIVSKGWHPNWYAGQTAYNDMLYDAEQVGQGIVLRLDRKVYAAPWNTEGVPVWHLKGERKMIV